MSILTLALPGVSKEGFLPREAVRDAAAKLGAQGFREAYPAPALLVTEVTLGPDAPADGDADATVRNGPQLMTLIKHGASAFRYMDQVGFLVKRPGNAFPQFVSVGRAANNDLVLAVERVSKFHAYFTNVLDSWSLTDYRSTNGTKLNGEKLEPNQPRPLQDGDVIEFGDQIELRFLAPEAFYESLRGRSPS
ncbi:MAG: FHA domain-containing protein [Vicinamibacteria bacterium]